MSQRRPKTTISGTGAGARNTLLGVSLFLGLAAVRIFNSLSVQTYFDPDEYWQSIEVAHQTVFGYGWLTWEWHERLRSSLYLLPFIFLFQGLKFLSLEDNDMLVIYGPRVIQALMAASIDYMTYRLALRLFSPEQEQVGECALFASLTSWFNMAYSTRTTSNNLETLLCLGAMLLWPIRPQRHFPLGHLRLALGLIGLAVLNRPSAVTHWLLPAFGLLVSTRGFTTRLMIIVNAIFMGGITIAFGLLLDRLFYGQWTLTWLNFVRINFFQNISEFYGSNPFYYHFLQSIPAIAGPFLPLIVIALACPRHNGWILQFVAGSLIFNSIATHKEIRFLSPVSPLLMILAGQGYYLLARIGAKGGLRILKRLFLFGILVTNLVLGVYFSRAHQSGPIAVMNQLREQIDAGLVKSIFFATNCHSTPYYGFLHRRVPLTFITCEPPLRQPDGGKHYLSEADVFFKDPAEYLKSHLDKDTSHIVTFQSILEMHPKLERLLRSMEFAECWRGFHSHFQSDPRSSGYMLIYCRTFSPS